METSLLVGLGNPGRKYRKNRHNVGFAVLDALAEKEGFKIGKKKFKALFAEEMLFERKVCLVKPQNFMNLSGEIVDSFLSYYKASPAEMLVVHDDIDLPVGKIKLSFGAGHGGHNGIRSIHDWIYTKDFYRLRLGVGRPPEYMDPADYVLANFSADEETVAGEMVVKSVEAILTFYKSPGITSLPL